MYGTSDQSGEEAAAPPRCPACQGRTYYVDPEQTVITCYDCGRYFRRKKEDGSPEAPAPPGAPARVPPLPVAPPPPPPPPAPPPYVPPAPAAPPEIVPEPEPVEDDGFDLMLGDTTEAVVPEPSMVPAPPGEDIDCSVCGFPMDGDWKVCPNCVSHYETQCGSCGRTLSAWWLICPWCETPKEVHHVHVGK